MKINEKLNRNINWVKRLQTKISKMKAQAAIDHAFKEAVKKSDRVFYYKIVDSIRK
jgi:hypothetical protein